MTNSTLPAPSSQKSGARSCLTVLILFVGYLLVSAVLLIVPTGFIGPVFAGGGLLLVGVIGLHYLVWGRWMSQMLEKSKEQDADYPDTPAGLK